METSTKEHLSGYQARDREVVDYAMYELADTGLSFRGPEFDRSGDYFTCLGAAQTFGCFCDRAYPQLLAERFGIPALNLGYGGAGPEFFDRRSDLDRFINGGRFAIVQIMSGRSQSNSALDCGGLELQTRRADGKRLGATAAWREMLDGPGLLKKILPSKPARMVGRLVSGARVRQLVAETRSAWVESYRNWLSRIEVPVVLVWFSRRAPEYQLSIRNTKTLFSDYPQLIDRDTVDALRAVLGSQVEYVECVTDRGMPQPLYSRFTGEPVTVNPADDRPDLQVSGVWTHNAYYPSPEMQEDVAAALDPICSRLMECSHG